MYRILVCSMVVSFGVGLEIAVATAEAAEFGRSQSDKTTVIVEVAVSSASSPDALRAMWKRTKTNIVDDHQGLRDVQWLETFPLFIASADAASILRLRRDDRVVRVEADQLHDLHLSTTLPAISAPAFHVRGGTGEGSAVAILDTPVRFENGEFGACPTPGAPGCRVREVLNFTSVSVSDVRAAEDAWQLRSHGSNVAGIALGVAPQADIVGINVFEPNSSGRKLLASTSHVLAALDWVGRNATRLGIVAVNLSLGSPSGPDPCNGSSWGAAIRALRYNHEVLTVIAAGNSQMSNGVGSPACVTAAVTVGAQHDQTPTGPCPTMNLRPFEPACFSNRSGLIDIFAPGVDVDAGGYSGYSGTSMAAPHVAGAIAALHSEARGRGAPFPDASAVYSALLTQASRPHTATDGRIFQRLDFAGGLAFSYSVVLDESPVENSGNRVAPGLPYQAFAEVRGRRTGASGVRVLLELLHSHPETLRVRVDPPSGASAEVQMPAGQSHFVGVLGEVVGAGAFTPLEGVDTDGRWTLTVIDGGGGAGGNILRAELLFLEIERCVGPTSCRIDSICYEAGATDEADPCHLCDPVRDDQGWSTRLDACRIDGRCVENGERPAGDQCRVCRPEIDRSGWTPAYDHCSIDDQCFPAEATATAGGCLVCDPARAVDHWSRSSQGCVIEGVCYADGERHPDNACLVCNPAIYTTDWSLRADACLAEGVCAFAGQSPPGLPCLVCDPDRAQNVWSIEAGHCRIADQCFAAGEGATHDTCQICEPDVSRSEFTRSSGCELTDGPINGDDQGCRCQSLEAPRYSNGWWMGVLLALLLLRGLSARIGPS